VSLVCKVLSLDRYLREAYNMRSPINCCVLCFCVPPINTEPMCSEYGGIPVGIDGFEDV